MNDNSWEIDVKDDHLEEITKASGGNAIEELIWNALDADATQIDVCYNESMVGGYISVIITDNGHGLKYEEVRNKLWNLGGSTKKNTLKTNQGRLYHGKHGKGRFKAFSLGDRITFSTCYLREHERYSYDVIWDRNDIKKPELLPETLVQDKDKRVGTIIKIENCKNSHVSDAFSERSIDRLI